MSNTFKTIIYVLVFFVLVGGGYLSYRKGLEEGRKQANQEIGEYIVNSINSEGVLRIKDSAGNTINLVPDNVE